MNLKSNRYFRIARESVTHFIADDCLSMAGALAYFSVFSLPGVLVIVISVTGMVFGEEAARGEISAQMERMMGEKAAGEIETMIDAAQQSRRESAIAAIVGLASLIIGATGVFGQLQNSLNKVWHVMPDPEKGGIKNFIKKRVLSFGMVAGLGFILLFSLAVSAAVAAMSEMVGSWMGSFASAAIVEIFHVGLSLVIFTALFAAIFKIMPDVHLAWRDVFGGALFTSLVFAFGKFAIGFYLGKSDVASGYGAAGSLVILLIWIYYSSLMLLAGAVFTYVTYVHSGKELRAESGAIVMREEKKPAPPGEAPVPA